MKININNQTGSALLYVLFFSLFATIVTLPLLNGSIVAMNSSMNSFNKLEASDLATRAYEAHLKALLGENGDNITSYSTTYTVAGTPVQVDVLASTPALGGQGTLDITTTATVNGATSRVVAAADYLDLTDFGVYSQGAVTGIQTSDIMGTGAVMANAAVYPEFDETLYRNEAQLAIGGDWTITPATNVTTTRNIADGSVVYFGRDFTTTANYPYFVTRDGIDIQCSSGNGFYDLLVFLGNAITTFFGNLGILTTYNTNGTYYGFGDNSSLGFSAPVSNSWNLLILRITSNYNYWRFDGHIFNKNGVVAPARVNNVTAKFVWAWPPLQITQNTAGLDVRVDASTRTSLRNFCSEYTYNNGANLLTSLIVNRY